MESGRVPVFLDSDALSWDGVDSGEGSDACAAGEIADCSGHRVPAEWLGDAICDDGAYDDNGQGGAAELCAARLGWRRCCWLRADAGGRPIFSDRRTVAALAAGIASRRTEHIGYVMLAEK